MEPVPKLREPNLLRAVEARLRAEGYDVCSARCGLGALARLAERPPDLVISDVCMPEMDGYTLVRRIRRASETELIPVIFLSARDRPADRIVGFRSGVDAYMAKPFEPEELLALIAGILERVRRMRAGVSRLVEALGTAAPAEPAQQPSQQGSQQAARQQGVWGLQVQPDPLTGAEERIATAVAEGLANKEIASRYGVSVRTVEKHISHILAKTGLGNRVEIARLVLARA